MTLKINDHRFGIIEASVSDIPWRDHSSFTLLCSTDDIKAFRYCFVHHSGIKIYIGRGRGKKSDRFHGRINSVSVLESLDRDRFIAHVNIVPTARLT